jgi:hypothetical protein
LEQENVWSGLGSAYRGILPTIEFRYADTTPKERCASCGSLHSHHSWCCVFRGDTSGVRFSIFDKAMLERHSAELYAFNNTEISSAVRAICEQDMLEAEQNGWRL